MRRFSTTGARLLKKGTVDTGALKLRAPIEPSVAQVKTPDDHPLWQFFGPKREYLRPASTFDNIGESWSVPQLRRKSVDDLHTLWYVCLKELNRLNREVSLVRQWSSEPGKDTHATSQDTVVEQTADKVRETMWRIRHVLAERYHGFRRGELAQKESYAKLLHEFSDNYLTADDSMDVEVTDQLERFQFAFFGINPGLEDNFPNPLLLKGLYTVAKLKLRRYGSASETPKIQDVREAFLIWTAEHSPEGISNALKTINEVRESGSVVEDEMVTLAELLRNFREAEQQNATSNM